MIRSVQERTAVGSPSRAQAQAAATAPAKNPVLGSPREVGATAPDKPVQVANKARKKLTDLPLGILNEISQELSNVDSIYFSSTCTATRGLREVEGSKAKEIVDDIKTIQKGFGKSSESCLDEKSILNYISFAKKEFKDQLDDYIQSYINTKLPKEKKALFDKLKETPGSTEKAKTDHTTAVTAMITDHPLLVFATNEYGFTPLHLATEYGHTEVANALLEAGAEVNATITDGFGQGSTPLHVAAIKDHIDIAELLLTNGADPTVTDSNGQTPLDLAEENTDTAELLYEAGETE